MAWQLSEQGRTLKQAQEETSQKLLGAEDKVQAAMDGKLQEHQQAVDDKLRVCEAYIEGLEIDERIKNLEVAYGRLRDIEVQVKRQNTF